ncbi:MAG: tetratricopeptide repeat protein [Thermoguttaceae bacterium]|jgi:tetratricopeptide (TPR) repeat protein
MYKVLISILVLVLLVALPANDSLAGRGGGGFGGGGFSGGHGGGFGGGAGGMARSSFEHTPSFSSPVAGANFSRSNFTPANRTGFSQLSGGQGLNVGQRGTINNFQRAGENRTGIENRANFENRSNFGDRTNIGNRSNFSDRTNFGNRAIAAGNQFNVNRAVNINGRNYGNWYHGDWHGHWDHPWHGWPAGWWAAGFAAGWGWGAATAPWSWGYWPYYNPYCIAPIVIDGGIIDYSQPIVVAAQPEYAVNDQSGGTDAQTTAADQAMQIFNTARESFTAGDYQTALSQVDSAIAKLPNDAVLHEFRGLVLFAMKRYQEAAAAVYAVLSVGPGWDWTTLSSLYPNVDVYTEQLRALEDFRRRNPKSAEAHFLLAYHYLTCGHTDAAAKEFNEVVSLNPKDQLSAQLLASLSTPAGAEEPKPSEPAAPPKPVDAAGLVGNWKATRSDGAAITLSLTPDGKFTWKFAQKDKPQEFSGDYTVADNLLILKQNNNPVMVGQVTQLTGNRFNFKLAGDNPNDPGLTFGK